MMPKRPFIPADYRELATGEMLERGDEFWYAGLGLWWPVPFIGKPASGLTYYRRPPIQQQIQFLHTAAVTSLESDRLRAIVAKESEHRTVIDENSRGRDRAVDLGRELERLRTEFARSFRDRVFIIGERVIDTSDGRYSSRGAEVVSA